MEQISKKLIDNREVSSLVRRPLILLRLSHLQELYRRGQSLGTECDLRDPRFKDCGEGRNLGTLRAGDHFSIFLRGKAGEALSLSGQFDETEPYRER